MLYGACAVLGGLALAVNFAKSGEAAWYLVALSLLAVAALWKLGYFRWSSARAPPRGAEAQLRHARRR